MKKFVSVFLSLCVLFTFCMTLTSCAHECEFSSEWSKDASAHWHACTKADCTEITDKADHTWDEGKITTAATQEADGVKTITCTVCEQTKTEAVTFTGFSKSEWDAAFNASAFENFAYTESSTTYGDGVSVKTETIYRFTKDAAWVKVTVAGQSESMHAPDTASANELRTQLVDSIKSLTSFADYNYDAATKTYKANKNIEIAALDASTSDITLTFNGNRLVEIKYAISFKQMGSSFTARSTVTLSDYGTVVLNPAQ